MKTETYEKLLNYLMLIGVLMVFLVGIFLVMYYFNFKTNECMADPFVYGAKQLEDQYRGIEAIGTVIFKTNSETTIEPIYFSSNYSSKNKK